MKDFAEIKIDVTFEKPTVATATGGRLVEAIMDVLGAADDGAEAAIVSMDDLATWLARAMILLDYACRNDAERAALESRLGADTNWKFKKLEGAGPSEREKAEARLALQRSEELMPPAQYDIESILDEQRDRVLTPEGRALVEQRSGEDRRVRKVRRARSESSWRPGTCGENCSLGFDHTGPHAGKCGCINGCKAWECPNV